jgi:ABC-type sugar transport system ATPase subunit
MTAKLLIQNVCKSFDVKGKPPLKVLQDITITVEKNEFAVIVGPSGCGKSTLLNIIGGLDYADTGEVLMDGSARKLQWSLSRTTLTRPLSLALAST